MGKLEALKKKKASSVSTREEIAETELAMTTKANGAEYRQLQVNAITFNPNNDYGKLDTPETTAELADDIVRNGLLHNIVVSMRDDGSYMLLSGERRLKAIKLLMADPARNVGGKYDTVMVKCIIGLDELDEMIILDAANLQTRGAASDEAIVRTAMARYVDNLKAKYAISDYAARALLMKVTTGSSNRTVYRNLKINSDLIPELLELLDNKEIVRYNAIDYCQCDPADQRTIYNILRKAQTAAAKGIEYADIVKKTIDALSAAAGILADDERRAAFEQASLAIDAAVAAVESKAAEPRNEKTDAPVIPAIVKKRAKYIDKYDKMAKAIHAMTRPAEIKAIRTLEKAEGEGSILASLDELAKEVETLRARLRGDEK